MTDTWMLYGANGYTGRLIVEEAVRRGLKPVLAGRREHEIRELAERHGLSWRCFGLDSVDVISANLSGCAAILLSAGPFSATSAPVVDACLRTRTHYLDITGELDVFEACHARDAEARARRCIILPGVGFDVVPSDCLAATLAQALPGADTLEIALAGGAGTSKGTAKTAVEVLGRGGAIRENGRIKPVPFAWRTLEVPFRDKARHVVSLPLADVATAYYSTGVPNIILYLALPRRVATGMKLARPFKHLMALDTFQNVLKDRIEKDWRPPDATARQNRGMHLWARVQQRGGSSLSATLETPEAYALTASTAVEATRRVCEEAQRIGAGTFTPSRAFGASFITTFDGCSLEVPSS